MVLKKRSTSDLDKKYITQNIEESKNILQDARLEIKKIEYILKAYINSEV